MEVGIKENLEKINQQKVILSTYTDVQVCLQLLVQKGIASREEVATMREKVNSQDKYKVLWDTINEREKIFKQYQSNPEQYLKDMFQAKLDGKI